MTTIFTSQPSAEFDRFIAKIDEAGALQIVRKDDEGNIESTFMSKQDAIALAQSILNSVSVNA